MRGGCLCPCDPADQTAHKRATTASINAPRGNNLLHARTIVCPPCCSAGLHIVTAAARIDHAAGGGAAEHPAAHVSDYPADEPAAAGICRDEMVCQNNIADGRVLCRAK